MPINPLQIGTQPTVPLVDFSALGKVGDAIADYRSRAEVADALSGAKTQEEAIDKLMTLAAKRGDIPTYLSAAKMRGESEAVRDFNSLFNPNAAPAAAARAPVASSDAPAASSASPRYGDAISSIESGGRYDLLGPVTRTGDRAFGKYQVMGANIGPWTREALGRELSPQEFLSSPEAQDRVFEAKFGSYVQKYGPEGAARAWFAGEGGMNDPNRRDQLGTTVSSYAQRFNSALGGPTRVASLQPGVGSDAPQAASAPAETKVAQAGGFSLPQSNPAQNIPLGRLIAAAANPRLPQGAREAAKLMLDKALKDSSLTDDQKEYAMHRAQGGTESFTDWMRANKKAGATAITNDMRGENAFSSEAGKLQAKRYNDLIEAGFAAKSTRADLSTLRELGSHIGTGKEAEIKAALGPYAEALNIKVDKLGEMQAYNAIISKLAPRMRPAGSGATSDFEMRKFLEALPGLGKNPNGNAIIEDTMEALQNHQEKAAEIASMALNKEITPKEADKMLRELPDPMTAWKEFRKQSGAGAPPKTQPQIKAQPQAGAVQDGYRFKGGNPADPASWERVQ